MSWGISMTKTIQELEFREDTHQYFLRGKELPSVTTILKDVGIIADGFYTPESAERGTYVHAATALIDAGEKSWTPRYADLEGYLDAWKKFKAENRPRWNTIEQPAASEAWKYAGTADRENITQKYYRVWEIKTGVPANCHRLQTGAYPLIRGKSSSERYCVYLQSTGSYKVERHEDPMDSQIFIGALRVYKEKRS